MDDATRAELDSLRRRAYGPAAEIPIDSDALRRLVELEELALPGAPTPPAPAENTEPARPVAPESTPLGSARGRQRMPRLHPAAAAAIVVACAALIGGFAAAGAQPSPSQTMGAGSPDIPARIHVPVQIDDDTGGFEDTAGVDAAPFPVGMQMSWVQSLGTYYGWSVWIGGGAFGSEDQRCLLVTDGSATRARCTAATPAADENLNISLPYERIGVGDRPPGMTEGQRVDVVWGQGGFVTVARD